MRTVEIKVGENKFRFRTEETIIDASRIESEASKLAGGRLEFAELKSAIDTAYDRVIAHNIEKYGEKQYKKLAKELNSLQSKKDFGDRYKELFAMLNDNPQFWTYMDLQKERNAIYSYARLIVLCEEKPEGYDFSSKSRNELDVLVNELAKEQAFFRR